MSNKEFAVKYLQAIEKKHESFFSEKQLKITDCIQFVGINPISIHITNQDLPFEIRHDIECLFWVT